MPLIDSHAHLDFHQFDADREAVIERAREVGVVAIVNIGTSLSSSRAAVALAEKYDFIYAAVGVHPHDAKTVTPEILAELRTLARHPKVVAVGEIGLDYYRDLSPRAVQRRVFADQLALAAELALPVVIHSREAHDDVLAALRGWSVLPPGGGTERGPGVLPPRGGTERGPGVLPPGGGTERGPGVLPPGGGTERGPGVLPPGGGTERGPGVLPPGGGTERGPGVLPPGGGTERGPGVLPPGGGTERGPGVLPPGGGTERGPGVLPPGGGTEGGPGVLHSYSAGPERLEEVLGLGFSIGISGPVTFPKANLLRAVAAAVPLERLLVETDCPYLTPQPYRGRRNEPAYVRYVVEAVARARGMPAEAVAQATADNTRRLFGVLNV